MVIIRPKDSIKLRDLVRVWNKPEIKVENRPRATGAVLVCMAQKTNILCPGCGASRVGLTPALTGSRV